MKWYFIVLIVLVAIVLAAFIAGARYIYSRTIDRKGVARVRKMIDESDAPPSPYRSHTPEYGAWWRASARVPHDITASDGITLHGYSLAAKEKTDKAVLIMHGHDCESGSIGFITKFFHDNGFNVVVPEQRGNAESGGSFYSFGIRESDDARRWLDKLIEIFGTDSKIAAYGNSLGGATVCLMAARDDLPAALRCIISDCAVSDLASVIKMQTKGYPAVVRGPMILLCDIMCRIFCGFSFLKTRPIDAVKHAKKPIFFVHGLADPTTDFEGSKKMYELCPTDKELMLVPECPHGVAYFYANSEYERRVLDFIQKHFR